MVSQSQERVGRGYFQHLAEQIDGQVSVVSQKLYSLLRHVPDVCATPQLRTFATDEESTTYHRLAMRSDGKVIRLGEEIAEKVVAIRDSGIPKFIEQFRAFDRTVSSELPQNEIEEVVKIATVVEQLSGEPGLVEACRAGNSLGDWVLCEQPLVPLAHHRFGAEGINMATEIAQVKKGLKESRGPRGSADP